MGGEVTLYNLIGDSIAYISLVDDYTIYLWNGEPVAYIFNNEYIYGFNGKHLGWFINGNIFNLNGKLCGVVEEKLGIIAKISSNKGIKKIKSIKKVRELPQIKPYFNINDKSLKDSLKLELLNGSNK